MNKRIICIVISIIICFVSISFAGELRKIADVKLGSMFPDKIQIFTLQDPQMPFITIYLTDIKAGNPLAFADPSNNSIATRLTGKITNIVKTMNPEVINLSKSIGWKTLKIARFWDEPNQCLVYVTYSTKVIDGSIKHSLSAVPLGENR